MKNPTGSFGDYRLGVGILLLNPEGLAFTGKRIDTTLEAWQLPQGGIDEGEEPQAAAFRELQEETGVHQASLLTSCSEWLHYDLPPDIARRIWGGRYKGQRQKWFAMRHEGGDSEINVIPGGEFSDWRWVRPETLPDLIAPFKRDLYQRLLEEFAPLLRN